MIVKYIMDYRLHQYILLFWHIISLGLVLWWEFWESAESYNSHKIQLSLLADVCTVGCIEHLDILSDWKLNVAGCQSLLGSWNQQRGIVHWQNDRPRLKPYDTLWCFSELWVPNERPCISWRECGHCDSVVFSASGIHQSTVQMVVPAHTPASLSRENRC